jgi:transcriptional regulator with XRE-family HTH domain
MRLPLKPYPELGALIAEGRVRLGMSQTAFAAALALKQQAVSRWEAATHRPDIEQIPALAKVLDEDAARLMELAGYAQSTDASLATLFPVDSLAPDTFERFVEALVSELRRDADVNILGSRGHEQKGSDIVATLPDGEVWSFQCKRVERFGIADIEKAIAYHKWEANRKFLVLSKVASPAAIEAVAAHPGWTLWDKQVLSRQLRTLSPEAQERLVDIYFRGQRMALLGRSEPGPWLTAQEYFAPFEGRSAIFTHDWPLAGRDADLGELKLALADDMQPVTLLLGPGGIGKTRVLKEGIERFARSHRKTLVGFLSTAQDADAVSLMKLGQGAKLLVIDDAHDREGLKLLTEFAVNPRNRTKLLIASRPYAEQRIRNELALYTLVDPPTVRLKRLDRAALRALVVNVLSEFDGDPDWADAILSAASDSPLVAAMAARVVAVDGKIPELARGEVKLRRFILSRFTDVVTGNLGPHADVPLLRHTLEVLALIQPFHIDDRRVSELVAATRAGVSVDDVARSLKLLVEGGVLYKRGALHRLMPDLLGDFLIEEACLGPNNALTDFATTVAEKIEADRLVQVLVNLGRADWRLADGDPTNSKLLEPIWRTLREIEGKYDGRIAAVEAVAYYQPAQAMEFVQAQIERGHILKEFGKILERVAYSPDHRRDALQLLWDLGKRDERDQRDRSPPHNHPVSILARLVGYEQNKPLSFSEDISDFAFGLLDEPGVWSRPYTPFDVLKPILSGQGMKATSQGKAINFAPFFINHDVVAGLRARLIDRMIGLLESSEPRAAVQAANLVNEAVRNPYGMMNSTVPDDLRAKYEQEFAATIARIAILLDKGSLAPPTIIALIRSLEWWAHYGAGPAHEAARDLFERIPADLDFRFHAAIAEGAEWTYVGQVPYSVWEDDKDWRGAFVLELLTGFPDRSRLCEELVAKLDAVESSGMSVFPAGQLVGSMIDADPAIGAVIIDRSLSHPDSRLRAFLGYAVGALLELRPQDGRAAILRMLDSQEGMIRSGGARGLVGLKRPYQGDDVAVLQMALQADDPDVAAIAIFALRSWRDMPVRELIPLLLTVDFGADAGQFENVAGLLCNRVEGCVGDLRDDEVASLLDRMKALPRLDAHWAGELLATLRERYGVAVAKMLLERIDLELAKRDDEGYRAIGFVRNGGGFGLDQSPDIASILAITWQWLRDHDGIWASARYTIGDALGGMFKLDTPAVVSFLDGLLDRASIVDLEWIGQLLRNSHHRFIFLHRDFVEHYLDTCRAGDPKLLERAIDQLEAAAVSGSWSGTVGEPMPRDLETRDEATAILASMSRLSAAYALYRDVLRDAKRNIEKSHAQAAAYEDEE